MGGRLRFLVGAILLVGGVLLGIYGLFAVLYNGDGDGGSQTYVTLAGHKVDADVAGTIALSLGAAALLGFVFLRRREPRLGPRAKRS